ncbi:hypothetical protein [Ideonella dechloratans]|uniref:hypothetical protein n=1 Tax=Ideonella dechloratans TaxID=36863 RepID=UPI0035B45AA3
MASLNPTSQAPQRPPIRERIRTLAFEILLANPQGLRYSDLHRRIRQADPDLKASTVNTSIWNLDTTHPERVYKPVKGLFRLLAFREAEPVETPSSKPVSTQHRIREEVFCERLAEPP